MMAMMYTATVWPSEKAMKDYLKKHPKANPSNHSFGPGKGNGKDEKPAKKEEKPKKLSELEKLEHELTQIEDKLGSL